MRCHSDGGGCCRIVPAPRPQLRAARRCRTCDPRSSASLSPPSLYGRHCWPTRAQRPVRSERTPIKVVHAYPHDDQAYTQGLIFHGGYLYESTGLYGRSSLRKIKLETGEIVQQRPLDARYFAEGLTEWRGELLQLTWRSRDRLHLRHGHVHAAQDILLFR